MSALILEKIDILESMVYQGEINLNQLYISEKDFITWYDVTKIIINEILKIGIFLKKNKVSHLYENLLNKARNIYIYRGKISN